MDLAKNHSKEILFIGGKHSLKAQNWERRMNFPSDFIPPARQTGRNYCMWDADCHYCGGDLISPFSRTICSFLGRHSDRISPGALASLTLKQSMTKAKMCSVGRREDVSSTPSIVGQIWTSTKWWISHWATLLLNAPLSSTGPGLITLLPLWSSMYHIVSRCFNFLDENLAQ